MADPRNVINHEGIGYDARTYKHDDTIVYNAFEPGGSEQVGLAVTLESDDTVSLVGDGEQVEGKLVKVEQDGNCVVQVGGTMLLPGGDGAALTVGAKIVGDLGPDSAEGYVQAAASATAAHHVVSRGVIENNDDTANVVVRFPTAN